MGGPVGEVREGVDGFPHAEIDDLELVLEQLDVRGVATVILKPPHKSGTAVRESVDPVEIQTKLVDARIVQRRPQASNVELSEMHRPQVWATHSDQ